MTFPINPTNGQLFELDDIEFVFDSIQNGWKVRAAQTGAEVTYDNTSWVLGGTPNTVQEAIDALSLAGLFSAEGVTFLGFFNPASPPPNPTNPTLGSWYQVDPSGTLASDWPSTTANISAGTVMNEGNIIRYDGTAWRLITIGGGATALGDLSDVAVGSAVNGNYLRFNGLSWQGGFVNWLDIISKPTFVTELADLSDWPASFNDLSDVNSSITNDSLLYKKAGNYVGSGDHIAGDLIFFDGTDWVALRPPQSPSDPQMLVWNGTSWEFRNAPTEIIGG